MSRTRNAYPTEFREQLVALARAGRSVRTFYGNMSPALRRSMNGSNRPVRMMTNAVTVCRVPRWKSVVRCAER